MCPHIGLKRKDILVFITELFLCAFLGVYEDDGPQQLAPLECLVPHVLSLYLHFSLSCHCAPLCQGEFVLKTKFQHVLFPPHI